VLVLHIAAPGNIDAAHGEHCDAPPDEKVPEGHTEQLDHPAREKVPAGQM